EPMVSFGQFAEPIELTTLIDFVGSSLNVNIIVKGSPTGEIVFNAPKQIAKSQLIDFLDAMLELYSFTVSYEEDSGFYIVHPLTDGKSTFGTERATTTIIPTPNIKPSLLLNALNATVGSAGGTGAAKATPIQAVDELGVLIVNAPPRDIARVEKMVAELIRLDSVQTYIRFDLHHLAAPIALDRVISLVGGSSSGSSAAPSPRGNPNIAPAGGIPSTGSSLSNLSDRLTIDPQGNALIFKGTQDEITRVRKVLAVIDVPNTLEPRNYFAGASAAQIADIAKRRGLGEVIQIEAATGQNPFNNFNGGGNQLPQLNSDQGQGGPVMVVDTQRGTIIYYGTDDQQAQLSALLKVLKTEDERVVIREYVLNHTDALTIADLLNGIITGEAQTGDSELLQGTAGRSNRSFAPGFILSSGDGEGGAFDPDKITVIPDEFSNQVIVKAPIKQQEDLEALITRLDKQRSQVYIQAIIVSISDNEDFALAFETQINAGQYSAGTDFGLSSPGTTFQDPKSVTAGISGLTQAVIMSEFVPIIVNASQTNSNVRILSTPQLLVNNNVESTIVSVSEQPFTTVTPTNGGSAESFGGFEEAGTTLTVTPSISDGGFIRMEYNIELSNFTAAQGIAGSPPPRDRNTLTGSVTVPSDATIVLGGITVEDVRDTVVKVPLLGDIPLVGELFKDTNKINNQSKLYVFLTPRIMQDPNFNDLKLFSEGPQSVMEIDDAVPQLEPAIITAPGNEVPQFELPQSTGPTSSAAPSNPPELHGVYIQPDQQSDQPRHNQAQANAAGDE
ncbi:MAG: secretin N-terminal domain-containing protein, partial [Phycisphaerales bacterium]